MDRNVAQLLGDVGLGGMEQRGGEQRGGELDGLCKIVCMTSTFCNALQN